MNTFMIVSIVLAAFALVGIPAVAITTYFSQCSRQARAEKLRYLIQRPAHLVPVIWKISPTPALLDRRNAKWVPALR